MTKPVGGPSKADLRLQVLAARRELAARRSDSGTAIRDVAMAWEDLGRAEVVAAYASFGTEPATRPLLDALRAAGIRVLLPVWLDDDDLDWAEYRSVTMQAVRGIEQPSGARLGVEAIRTADLVLVPGLAVSEAGDRLGRGGGSYDRALARVALGTPVAVVLHPEEVGLDVPTEPHDRPVTHALTSAGVTVLAHPHS